MTRDEALENAIKVWEWLAENPTRGKVDAYDTLNLTYDICYCPCCEYADRLAVEAAGIDGNPRYMCDFCPAWVGLYACERDTTGYDAWRKQHYQSNGIPPDPSASRTAALNVVARLRLALESEEAPE